MGRITTCRPRTGRIYDGGSIRLVIYNILQYYIILYYIILYYIILYYITYQCVTTAYSIQYSNMLYRFVA
jgi:hypothetical protein